jgi:hypothetical protein
MPQIERTPDQTTNGLAASVAAVVAQTSVSIAVLLMRNGLISDGWLCLGWIPPPLALFGFLRGYREMTWRRERGQPVGVVVLGLGLALCVLLVDAAFGVFLLSAIWILSGYP